VFTKNGTAARHRIGAQATGLSVEDARPATGAPSGSDHIKAGDLDLRPGLQQLFGVRRGSGGCAQGPAGAPGPDRAHRRVLRINLDQHVYQHRCSAYPANHFRSAGMTDQGAHPVLVADSISENACW